MDISRAIVVYGHEKDSWLKKGNIYSKIIGTTFIDGMIRIFIHAIHTHIQDDDIKIIVYAFIGILLPDESINQQAEKLLAPYEKLFRANGPKLVAELNKQRIIDLGIDDESIKIQDLSIPLSAPKLSQFISKTKGPGAVVSDDELYHIQQEYIEFRKKAFENENEQDNPYGPGLRVVALAQYYKMVTKEGLRLTEANYKNIADRYMINECSIRLVKYFSWYCNDDNRLKSRGTSIKDRNHLKRLKKAISLLDPDSKAFNRAKDELKSFELSMM